MTHKTRPLAVNAEQYLGEVTLKGMAKRDVTDSNNYTSKKWCVWSPQSQRYLPVAKGDWIVRLGMANLEFVSVVADNVFKLLYEELPPEGVS